MYFDVYHIYPFFFENNNQTLGFSNEIRRFGVDVLHSLYFHSITSRHSYNYFIIYTSRGNLKSYIIDDNNITYLVETELHYYEPTMTQQY